METKIEKIEQSNSLKMNSLISIKSYSDPNIANMGLENYGLALFEGTSQEESIMYLDTTGNGKKRYITGLNEFAPEVQALKIGKISKAKRCQKRANMLIQQLEKDDIQRAVEYKRGVLAGLNVSLDISTEKVQVWLNRFKGCWREEDFNKNKISLS